MKVALGIVRLLGPNMAAEAPIDLSTFGSLTHYGYRTDVDYWRCERSVTIDAGDFWADRR